jgi:multimeric flavodoxin WrbA
MKAICIIGSRKNGNTEFLVDKIVEGMEDAGVKTKKYILGSMNIGFCKGCKYCSESRKCIQNDDANEIIEELFKSDIVLIASPSYWGDITGQLKTFIDRCTPLCDTKKGGTIVPDGKIGISVAIRAGQRIMENTHIIETIEHYYGNLGIKPVARFTMERVDQITDFQGREEELKKAFEIGLKIKELM